ncbi:hypothetical protein AAW51_4089 [Caldimonas brevitalea]|uniref:PEP-CTERM protein-sorting domain-containing protein n=1 Tax=Caldimonas brevitalea TaxID=413882 RepID=A0A0G3BWA2_9BURK|nr:hypothetical protein AAW51_4089 [Caldimonas brevitalea]
MAILAGSGLAAAEAAPRYRLVSLDGFNSAYSTAVDISENGLVTGYVAATAYDAENVLGRAYIYKAGVLRTLPSLGGYSAGGGINRAGQVAMSSSPSWYIYDSQPAWFDGVSMHGLGQYGSANDINEKGQIVGGITDRLGVSYDAFVYDNQGTRMLGSLGGDPSSEGTDSVASAINDSGQVAGYASIADYGPVHAFRHDGESMHDLGTLGGMTSWGYGINDAGHVVGMADLAGNAASHAFLHDGVTMHDLGTLGGNDSSAMDVNSHGHVVGSSMIDGGTQHAFLFDGSALLDLHLLLDSSGAGWTLRFANAINDRGEIVGTGVVDGVTRAFLLTPVPEPHSYVLMLAGLAAVAARQVRRGAAGPGRGRKGGESKSSRRIVAGLAALLTAAAGAPAIAKEISLDVQMEQVGYTRLHHGMYIEPWIDPTPFTMTLTFADTVTLQSTGENQARYSIGKIRTAADSQVNGNPGFDYEYARHPSTASFVSVIQDWSGPQLSGRSSTNQPGRRPAD